jgi:arsenate reductase
MIIYGINNCDTVKKARRWLDSRSIDYKFHDFRKQGLNEKIINGWLQTVSWDKILNKRSTSWRNLDASIQQTVNETTIVDLLLENPTLIKRPVMDVNDTITVGFNSDTYEGILTKTNLR